MCTVKTKEIITDKAEILEKVVITHLKTGSSLAVGIVKLEGGTVCLHAGDVTAIDFMTWMHIFKAFERAGKLGNLKEPSRTDRQGFKKLLPHGRNV